MKRLFLGAIVLIVTCTMGPEINDDMTFGSFGGESGRKITVRFDRGPEFQQIKKMGFIKARVRPQIAVWMEDTLGGFLGTIYVTNCFGKQVSQIGKPNPDSCFRPMCMPYWLNRYRAAGNPVPTPSKPLPDAITGATPTGSFTIKLSVPDSVKLFTLFAEYNRSYDHNDTFTEKRTSFNGQPSVIFSTRIALDDTTRTADTLKLIGRGGETGGDGKLYNDMDKLTTALKVFGEIVAERGK